MAIDHVSSDRRSAYLGPVPGHVAEIRDRAVANGLSVQLHTDDEKLAVVVVGTETGFRAAKLVMPGLRFPVRYRARTDGAFCWEPLKRVTPDTFSGELSEEVPIKISDIDGLGVEEVRYRDRKKYAAWGDAWWRNRRALWGTPADVERAAGLRPGTLAKDLEQLRTGGRPDDGTEWEAVYYPSGKVWYFTQEPYVGEQPSEERRIEIAIRALESGEQKGPVFLDSPEWEISLGTKENLIDAGVCSADQFPAAGPRYRKDGNLFRRWKHGKTGTLLRGEENVTWVINCLRGGYFDFRLEKTKARRDAAKARIQTRDSRYDSPSAYEAYAREWIEKGMNIIRNVTCGYVEKGSFGETTLRFDGYTIEQVEEALETIEDAIRCGSVRWTPRAADRRDQVNAAKADAGFQDFLGHLVAGAPPLSD
jgi:hypothetical protein